MNSHGSFLLTFRVEQKKADCAQCKTERPCSDDQNHQNVPENALRMYRELVSEYIR